MRSSKLHVLTASSDAVRTKMDEDINFHEDGNTPSMARQVFLKDLQKSCNDEITYHVMKADRSVTPRRRDFNYLYSQFTKEQFGGKNGD